MRVTRVLDVLVLLLLAALLVIPRPDVTVKPALTLAPERRERVAELQAHLLGAPGDVDAAMELANLYLDGRRPDWALATIGGVLEGHENDYRLHLLRAIAYADRFEAPPAHEAAQKALSLCDQTVAGVPPCGEAPRARIGLLASTLERISGIDMRRNPALAKERIFEALHPVWVPKGARARPAAGGASGKEQPEKPAPSPPAPSKG